MYPPCRLLLITTLFILVTTFSGHAAALKVGINTHAPTLEFSTDDGTASGLLVDLWRNWASHSGHSIEFVLLDKTNSEQQLKNGSVDFVANATPGKQLVYSQAYAEQAFYFFTQTGKPLTRLSELPFHIGLLDTDAAILSPILSERGRLTTFSSHAEMLNALQRGTISALAANDIALNLAIPTTNLLSLHYPAEPFYTHPIQAASLESRRSLLNEFSAAMAKLDSRHKKLLQARWQPSTVGFRLPWPLIGGAVVVLVISALLIFFWLMNSRLEHQVRIQTLEIEQQKQNLEKDIDRRKTLEVELKAAKVRADSAVEEKAHFLATMTHELRTPLVGVLGMNELLRQTELTPHQQALLETVQNSGETLLELVNDLLDFSKLDSRNLSLRLEPLNLPELMTQTIAVFEEQSANKQLTLSCHVAPEAYWEVHGDPLRLRQIILNLVSNAVKFTPQGEVQVSLELLEKPLQNGIFCIEVKDTGIGMHEDVRNHIFAPFVQAENSNQIASYGTGLGLSIVKQLVELMSGTIDVESRPGKGSLFRVKLQLALINQLEPSQVATATPVLPSQETLQASSNMHDPSQTSDSGTSFRRILVVDDYPVTRQLVKHSLSGWNLEIDEADNGNQALTLAEAGTYGLILMDRSMPQLDGLETTRLLRERGYTAPIVALTAHSDSETVQACLAAGMDDFLPKPFRQKQLFQTIETWLEIKKEHNEDL